MDTIKNDTHMDTIKNDTHMDTVVSTIMKHAQRLPLISLIWSQVTTKCKYYKIWFKISNTFEPNIKDLKKKVHLFTCVCVCVCEFEARYM